MGYYWFKKNGITYCKSGTFTKCGNASFFSPPPDSNYSNPLLAQATEDINRILDRLREENQDPNVQLSILWIPGGFMLDWTIQVNEDDADFTSQDDDAEILKALKLT